LRLGANAPEEQVRPAAPNHAENKCSVREPDHGLQPYREGDLGKEVTGGAEVEDGTRRLGLVHVKGAIRGHVLRKRRNDVGRGDEGLNRSRARPRQSQGVHGIVTATSSQTLLRSSSLPTARERFRMR
jgi:hypothetical protein